MYFNPKSGETSSKTPIAFSGDWLLCAQDILKDCWLFWEFNIAISLPWLNILTWARFCMQNQQSSLIHSWNCWAKLTEENISRLHRFTKEKKSLVDVYWVWPCRSMCTHTHTLMESLLQPTEILLQISVRLDWRTKCKVIWEHLAANSVTKSFFLSISYLPIQQNFCSLLLNQQHIYPSEVILLTVFWGPSCLNSVCSYRSNLVLKSEDSSEICVCTRQVWTLPVCTKDTNVGYLSVWCWCPNEWE